MCINKSWKRIEVLNIIDKIGLDVKQYSYLKKPNLLKIFGEYIIENNIIELKYLLNTKPVIHLPVSQRTLLTKKAKKIQNYCNTLDLELCEYNTILQVSEDINIIKPYTHIPCIRKAIELWNYTLDENIPGVQINMENELSIEEEKLIKQRINSLTVKQGKYLITFD